MKCNALLKTVNEKDKNITYWKTFFCEFRKFNLLDK